MQRFLGEDVRAMSVEDLETKVEEARIAREFEVGVIAEAIALAFKKR